MALPFPAGLSTISRSSTHDCWQLRWAVTGRTVLKLWSVCAGSLPGSWWTRTCSPPGMGIGVGEGWVQDFTLLAGSKDVEGERCLQIFYLERRGGFLVALPSSLRSLP